MKKTPTQYVGGIGFGSALFLLFLALKLTGVIGWSWWAVTAPLWLPVAVVLVISGFLVAFAALLVRGFKCRK